MNADACLIIFEVAAYHSTAELTRLVENLSSDRPQAGRPCIQMSNRTLPDDQLMLVIFTLL